MVSANLTILGMEPVNVLAVACMVIVTLSVAAIAVSVSILLVE